MLNNTITKKNNIFGTKEWATHTINILNGCHHDCKYCYSKEMAIRFKRKNVENWKFEELNNNLSNLNIPNETGIIMFPSSHDLSPSFIEEEKKVIDYLISKNKNILLVTKPHYDVIKEICNSYEKYKNNIKFRFSIGSCNNDVLKFWEPNAPSIEERLESLKYAYYMEYETSVSCEPILDNKTIPLVDLLLPFISDSIWIGKPNFLKRRLKINGFNFNSIEQKRAIELLQDLNDNYILELYNYFSNNNKIKWKESIKKIVGIKLPLEVGMDI